MSIKHVFSLELNKFVKTCKTQLVQIMTTIFQHTINNDSQIEACLFYPLFTSILQSFVNRERMKFRSFLVKSKWSFLSSPCSCTIVRATFETTSWICTTLFSFGLQLNDVKMPVAQNPGYHCIERVRAIH